MSYKPQTLYLTTDSIVEIYNDLEQLLGIILIQRKNIPPGSDDAKEAIIIKLEVR